MCVLQPWVSARVTALAMIARVFGCAACDGRALARWELEAGVSGVVNAADGNTLATLLMVTNVN